MDEIVRYQETIIESLTLENDRFSGHTLQLPNLDDRLANLKRSMQSIEVKATKLRNRATKMLEERQKSRERQELLEKALEPVVNTN